MKSAVTGFLRHDGARIRYSVEGSGPHLLICSGIGASLELTRSFRTALDGKLSTIAWDAPGSGESTVPFRRPSLRLVAEFAVALLDHLDVSQADVLGVSWGGLVAQELSHRHPTRVRRLVLASTGTGWTSVPGDLRVLPIMLSTRRYTSPAFLERVGPRLYGGDVRADPQVLRRQGMERLLHPPSSLGYWWQLLATVGWTSFFWLPSVNHPSLVMAADDDPIADLANARIIARRLPRATLHVVKGGGHLFLITRPEETAGVVARFLVAPDAEQPL